MSKLFLLCNYCTFTIKKWDGQNINQLEKTSQPE